MKDVISWALSDSGVTTITLIASALGVSVLTQAIKNWLDLNSPKLILFLTIGLSFISVAILYFTYYAGQNPEILGSKTALVLGIATILYRYLVQPFYIMLQNSKAYKSSLAAQAVVDTANDIVEAKCDVVPAVAEAKEAVVEVTTSVNTAVANVVPISDEFAG